MNDLKNTPPLPDLPTRAESDCQRDEQLGVHEPRDVWDVTHGDLPAQETGWFEDQAPLVGVVSQGPYPLNRETQPTEYEVIKTPSRRMNKAVLALLICGMVFLQAQLLRVYAAAPHVLMEPTSDKTEQASAQPFLHDVQQYSTAQNTAAHKLSQIETASETAHHDFDQFLSRHLVAHGVTSQESGSFALWSQGRFAVSDTTGSEVLFEVDPKRRTTGIFGPVMVKGELTLRGALTTENITSTGEINAPSFSAGGFSANQEGVVHAQSLSAERAVQTGSVETSSLNATSAHIAGDLHSEGTIKAHKLVVDDLVVGGKRGELGLSQGARNIKSNRAVPSETEGGEGIEGSGTLSDPDMHPQSWITGMGMLTFISPMQGGENVQKLRVPCTDETAAIFTSVQDQNTSYPAVIGVEETQEGFFIVCRFPKNYDGVSHLNLVYLAVSKGSGQSE